MSAHAPIAPSLLYRTVQCPGWLRLAEHAPPEALAADEDLQPAEDGVAAHWALAEVLQGRLAPVGTRAPNGVLIDEEMAESIEVAVDAVDALVDEFGFESPQGLVVEQPVRIARIHSQCWGTPDLRFWGRPRGSRLVLVVLDFKYGHEFVEVFENLQLIAYTAGEIEERGLHDLQVEVVNVIVQPRSFHKDGPVRQWRYRAEEIRGLVNRCSNAANEALGHDPRLYAGPSCKHCPARIVCPALIQAGGAAMDSAHAAIPAQFTAAGIGIELRFAQRAQQLLKARVAALEQQAMSMVRAGQPVLGYRLDYAAGRKAWKKPDAEIIELGRMMGVDLGKPQEAITPLQAAAKGLPDVLVDSFSERRTGAATLLPDDGSKYRRVFGGQA